MTGNQEAEVCHKQADLRASALINRHEFGIGRGLMVRAAASPTVTIKIDLVAVQQAAHEQETEKELKGEPSC